MILGRYFLLLLGLACWTATVSASSKSSNDSNDSSDSCFSNPQEYPDFVPHLPGFNQPLPSAWFSGYLTYQLEGRTIHTHYVLIQAEEGVDENVDNLDETDTTAAEKPLIYWSNGGPGASSLFGLLTELGPLLLDDRSLQTQDYMDTGIPTPVYNPNAWTRLGHLLIIDQPAPVGFSYCDHYNETETPDDPHSCGGLSWTDELAAANTLAALEVFYQDKFPCLSPTNLYLTGESYAGIYIPTLARSILEQHGSTADGNADPAFGKLQGLAVGDGCLGTETDICRGVGATEAYFDLWAVLFMAGHHQIPLDTFRSVLKACRVGSSDNEMAESATGDVCQAALKEVDKEVGGYYEYSLYDDCTYRNGLTSTSSQTSPLTGAVNDYACGGGIVMQQYINLDAVQDAFHVESEFFEVDNAEGFDYTPTEKDLTGFYKSINGKLRVLVYNGDTDPAITSFAAQNWTSHLDFTETEAWRPWTVDGCRRMGGYVTRYEGDFDFLTIRGAGHMVPAYKPKATFTFLKAWIEGKDYPIFDETCKSPDATHEAEVVSLTE